MATADFATPCFSIPKPLFKHFSGATPMYGDKSKIVAGLIKLWLSGKIHVPNVNLRSQNARRINELSIATNASTNAGIEPDASAIDNNGSASGDQNDWQAP